MTENGNTTPAKSDQGFYYVKNWKKFQHYKRKSPPWVKLHRSILTSPDWIGWSDCSKLLAIVCIMIASQFNGKIPRNRDYIKRVGCLSRLPNLKPLIECGFLSETLDTCYNDTSDTLETLYQPDRPYVSASVSLSASSKLDSKEESKSKSKKEGSNFVFESGVIRLTEQHLKRWEASFSEINVRAELEPLAEWAAKQTNWFMAVAGALAKKNREAADRRQAIKVGIEAGVKKPSKYFSV